MSTRRRWWIIGFLVAGILVLLFLTSQFSSIRENPETEETEECEIVPWKVKTDIEFKREEKLELNGAEILLALAQKNYDSRRRGHVDPLLSDPSFSDIYKKIIKQGESSEFWVYPDGTCPIINIGSEECLLGLSGSEKFLYDNFYWGGYHLRGKGYYVDLQVGPATSKTVFLDGCLGWDGLVITSAERNLYNNVKIERSGKTTFTCITTSKASESKNDCKSLDSILQDHEVKKIDFLSLGAMGSDYDLINNFDFSKYQVDLFTVEKYPGFVNRNTEMMMTMVDKGYILMHDIGPDYWFVRSPGPYFKLSKDNDVGRKHFTC